MKDQGSPEAPASTLKRWAPLLLLVALLLATWGWRAVSADMRPVLEADTEGYLTAPPISETVRALSYFRTVGYPLFLQHARKLGPGFSAIPWVQAAIFTFAILYLYLALKRFTGRAWIALLAVLPLPFAATTRYTASLLTESLAASLTLMVVASVLWLVHTRSRCLAWPALVIAALVFAAIQVRPTTQWLVVWVPIAVAMLAWRSDQRRRRVAIALLATALPWLAFSTLRYSVVGHFGLVSFTGTNLAAVATFVADADSVDSMPRGVKPIGRLIVKRRDGRDWPRLRFGDDSRDWFRRYNQSLWKVAYRSANWHMHRELQRAQADSGVDLWGRTFPVERDRRLQVFALTAIRNQPGAYASWVWGAIRYGLAGMGRTPAVLVGVGLLVVASAWRLFSRSSAEIDGRITGVGITWLTHTAGALLLVCMISFPMARYLSEVILLLPSALILLATAIAPVSAEAPR